MGFASLERFDGVGLFAQRRDHLSGMSPRDSSAHDTLGESDTIGTWFNGSSRQMLVNSIGNPGFPVTSGKPAPVSITRQSFYDRKLVWSARSGSKRAAFIETRKRFVVR
jgi:hypothetical protein